MGRRQDVASAALGIRKAVKGLTPDEAAEAMTEAFDDEYASAEDDPDQETSFQDAMDTFTAYARDPDEDEDA